MFVFCASSTCTCHLHKAELLLLLAQTFVQHAVSCISPTVMRCSNISDDPCQVPSSHFTQQINQMPNPWPALRQVEVDGERLELAPDIEGILIINIPSYMGGVNLWASSATSPSRRRFAPQSLCDGMLEV